ncbi:hypothetical protein [Azospirillum sp. sgz302134]
MTSVDALRASTTLFSSTQAAAGLFKPAPNQTKSASASGAAEVDLVDLSPLAAALKGDAMKLFSRLEDKDRSSLASLVTSGAMSADEMNSALTDRLKQARGKTFWTMVDEHMKSPQNKELIAGQDRLSALSKTIEDKMSAIEKMGNRQEMMKAYEGMNALFEEQSSLMQRGAAQPLDPSMQLTGTFAVTKLYRSEGERAAGDKLSGLGFASKSFDAAVNDIARDDVANRNR